MADKSSALGNKMLPILHDLKKENYTGIAISL